MGVLGACTDVGRAITFAISNDNIRGPVNVTSPSPMKMKDFGKTIGSVLHRHIGFLFRPLP